MERNRVVALAKLAAILIAIYRDVRRKKPRKERKGRRDPKKSRRRRKRVLR